VTVWTVRQNNVTEITAKAPGGGRQPTRPAAGLRAGSITEDDDDREQNNTGPLGRQ